MTTESSNGLDLQGEVAEAIKGLITELVWQGWMESPQKITEVFGQGRDLALVITRWGWIIKQLLQDREAFGVLPPDEQSWSAVQLSIEQSIAIANQRWPLHRAPPKLLYHDSPQMRRFVETGEASQEMFQAGK